MKGQGPRLRVCESFLDNNASTTEEERDWMAERARRGVE